MSSDKPVLSITIPTFNRANYLQSTLDRLFKEIDKFNLHNNVQVVVCNNASEDNTDEVVQPYLSANKYHFLYKRNEKNIGVIRNILQLIQLSEGKYWMFYGDDDHIAEGALSDLVMKMKLEDSVVWMFKWQNQIDNYCHSLNEGQTFNIEELASEYFYYIGNAGIFAVDTIIAKLVVAKHEPELISTCWPQTIVIFLTLHYSKSKLAVFHNIVTSEPPKIQVMRRNCFYVFETSIYAMLRTAIIIEKHVSNNFVSQSIKSIEALRNFDFYKQSIIQGYCYWDNENQRKNFIDALKEANSSIKAPFNKQIKVLHNIVFYCPKWLIKIYLYLIYIKDVNSKKINTSYLNRLKIFSPWGYSAYLNSIRKEMAVFSEKKLQIEVDKTTGYF